MGDFRHERVGRVDLSGQNEATDRVVGRKRQAELPVNPRQSAMPGLREARHRLHPAEDFLDSLAVNLAGLVGRARRHLLADVRTPARSVARRVRLSTDTTARYAHLARDWIKASSARAADSIGDDIFKDGERDEAAAPA